MFNENLTLEETYEMTLEEIYEMHPGKHIQEFHAGLRFLIDLDREADCLDVIVWDTEDDSENDDGGKAIARYLILIGEAK